MPVLEPSDKEVRSFREILPFQFLRLPIKKLLGERSLSSGNEAINKLTRYIENLRCGIFHIHFHKSLPVSPDNLCLAQLVKEHNLLEVFQELDPKKAAELRESKLLLLEAMLQYETLSLKEFFTEDFWETVDSLRFTAALLRGDTKALGKIPAGTFHLACEGLEESKIMAIVQKVKQDLSLDDQFLQSLNSTKQDAERSL